MFSCFVFLSYRALLASSREYSDPVIPVIVVSTLIDKIRYYMLCFYYMLVLIVIIVIVIITVIVVEFSFCRQ